MKTSQKVLACVDRSHFADTVADYAIWAALRLEQPLEFLHVIDRSEQLPPIGDRSGAIGMDTQEHLLVELASTDQEHSLAAREEGRLFLNRLRQRALAQSALSADMRQRHGALHETLVEQQDNVSLFVLGRRGESAETTQRDLGRNVERMVRALRKPILAVTEGFVRPSRVLIAFDNSAVIRRGVEFIAASPLLAGLPLLVVTAGKPVVESKRGIEWATKILGDAGFSTRGEVLPGDPERVIAKAVIDHGIDLIVMGAFGHAPLRSLLFGSKTSGLLRSARVPTLLVR